MNRQHIYKLVSALYIYDIFQEILWQDCTTNGINIFNLHRTSIHLYIQNQKRERERERPFMSLTLVAGIQIFITWIIKLTNIKGSWDSSADKAVKYSCKKMQCMDWSFSPLFPVSHASSFKNCFQNPWIRFLSSGAAGTVGVKDFLMLLLYIVQFSYSYFFSYILIVSLFTAGL